MSKNFLRNILFIITAILVIIQSIFVFKGTDNITVTAITSFISLSIGMSLIIICFHFDEKQPDISALNLTDKYKTCILKHNNENQFDILLRYYEYAAKLENNKIIIHVSRPSEFVTTITTTDYKWFYENFIIPNK